MGEDLCDQPYRAEAVRLWPLSHPSASIQNQKSNQVWGQMSSQRILNANLWLAKTILILKAACGYFFLIKTTHPPVSTHHCIPHHSCCLYHYYTAAPKSQLCPGEIKISTRWNPHLSSTPHLKLPQWYGHLQGLQEGQGSRRVPWTSFYNLGDTGGLTPLQSPDNEVFPPPAWPLLHKCSTLSSLLHSNGSHQEGGPPEAFWATSHDGKAKYILF